MTTSPSSLWPLYVASDLDCLDYLHFPWKDRKSGAEARTWPKPLVAMPTTTTMSSFDCFHNTHDTLAVGLYRTARPVVVAAK